MEIKSANISAAAETFTIWFDGQPVQALPSETIAAALSRQNIVALRHNEQGEARGLWCGMGACYECVVEVDGKHSQRSCMTLVSEGMQIASRRRADSQPQPLATAPSLPAPPQRTCDLLIVGAGPAGLSAARIAARAGATVIVLDERPQSGGQFFKPLAASHLIAGKLPKQWRDGQQLLADAQAAGAEIIQQATVWAAFSPQEIAVIIDQQTTLIHARQLIIATGAYERPVPFPGWTLPGVMTTGAGQTLAKAYRVVAGERVVVSGNGPLNLQYSAELLESGGGIVELLERAAKPGIKHLRQMLTLLKVSPQLLLTGRHYLSVLKKHRVPVHWGQEVVAAHGSERLESVTVMRVDADGQRIAGSSRTIACDVLCLGHGFIPSTDLARMLGCEQQLSTTPFSTPLIKTDENGATSVPGVYVVGDGARLGGAQVALARGTLAAVSALSALGFTTDDNDSSSARGAVRGAEDFQRALWQLYQAPPVRLSSLADDTVICRCENISLGSLRTAIRQGIDTPAALKRNLRVGMGLCQGRTCSGMVVQLVEEMTQRQSDTEGFFAPRLPARPVPISLLAFEKKEWGGHKPAITPNLARPVETSPLALQKTDVLVIGGGVMGNCLGYYLADAGAEVLVVERDDINLQASGANAGSLHVQLLSFDFGAKAEQGGGPAAQTLPLGPLSVQLWQQLEAASGESLEIKITGGLMVAETPQEMRFLEQKIKLEQSYGIDACLLDATQLARLSPHLSPNLTGAEFCPMEGKINPLRATYVVNQMARNKGARFQRGTDVMAIEPLKSGGYRVQTSRGVIEARRVVNAAGAWAARIGEMVGAAIPVKGAPLQMVVTERAEPLIDHLIAHAGRHLSLKQTAHGSLLIGGGWSAGFNPAMRMNQSQRESIEGNLWVATRVLPALERLHMVRSWAGMNINIDGAPIIGELPTQRGFYNAVTSNGYTLAPVVAHSLTQLILSGSSDINLAPYHISRFN
ncbi:glycine/D-amino acid oxidase-like deaminating enzyme/bacterioferritin-associated ferredoxin [Erwinia toletana]|uniref:Glycine/D-amino acid oxidase-like deaminating enzyme/bacterioferritin-associated ferredoxin n=1 Tax=Winslowiella toletana TaxID=92490 RepID=A0ABS4PAD8_9GAMM|nr:FAD-dependent oxidoreductase [Winslowiella toletana]MBP2169572.1 glycine/D-amino acid oxidase-like deaminating enzyme/bacterioferritin-associated ferredoxin [Winslowiella toletana]